MLRSLSLCLAAFVCLWSQAAFAQVTVSFHSFNGSVLFGRYPHAFIVLEGTEEATGRRVNENYGFSARAATPAVLAGPVEHTVMTEDPKWIGKTNRHLSVPISDDQYRQIQREVAAWRDHPGKFYSLDSNNCIHFVGAIAKIVGVKVGFPKAMMRKPRAWLNHIVATNPQLKGKQF